MRLFCKTWSNDYSWLKLAMKSVARFSKEPVEWTVIGDRGSLPHLKAIGWQAMQECCIAFKFDPHEVQEFWPECDQITNGYYSQQWIKMNAFRVMGDDYFLNWDSDVIAVRPFDYNTFLGKSGRPIFWISQFNHLIQHGDVNVHNARRDVMREICSIPEVPFEYMRCMPVPMNGNILRCASTRDEWSKSFNAIKNSRQGFSEFNIIGLFSHLYFPDAYEWRNAETQGPAWAGGWDQNGNCFQAHAYVSQGYSWNGVPKHLEDFVNKL